MRNHHEKLGLGEHHVQFILLFPIWQVWLLIEWLIIQIQGLQNPTMQVIPPISHICSYPPYHSQPHPLSLFLIHSSPIIAEHKVNSSLSISPCHVPELTLSTNVYLVQAYTEYKHTPSKACTEYYSIHPRLSVPHLELVTVAGSWTITRWCCHVPIPSGTSIRSQHYCHTSDRQADIPRSDHHHPSSNVVTVAIVR